MSLTSLEDGLGDPNRLQVLHRLGLLDSPPQEAFDRLTQLVRAMLDVPVALITLLDHDRQFLLSADGLAEPWATRRETPLSHSFCQHVIGSAELLEIADATSDPRVRDNLAIAELGVVAYLGLPLRALGGQVVGALCAIDHQPRAWTKAHKRILTDLAAMTANELALRELASQLEARVAEEMAARLAAQDELARKRRLEALGQLAGGVAHDFGNVLQAVQSGVHLARKYLESDPAKALRMLDAVGGSVRRGSAITRRLLGFARRGEAAATVVVVSELLADLRDILMHTLNSPGLQLVVEAEPELTLMVDRGELEAVLINLATNARDAMPRGGRLVLRAVRERNPLALAAGDYVRLVTEDTGMGMSPEVLARAPEAFFTTKPEGSGTGLGLSMARDFATQAGGSMGIESEEGQGTRVVLWLPLHTEDEAE